MPVPSHPTGGAFLIVDTPVDRTFAPERLNDDHRAIGRTVDEFWAGDVAPQLDALHRHVPGTARALLRKAADLGLTSMQISEADGGLGLDLPSVIVAIEHLARDGSYLGWHLGHCGIGMLPLALYGTDAQKRRYLGRLMSADLVGAYALTEAHAGSDALAIRTRADLTPDGRHYRLSGQKMWITNGGEADLFTVFAKVDGDAFTAFLVERAFGVTNGAEEHKMGLAGTSTTAVYLDDVLVPVENVLGVVGRGHTIAFNVLNIGRLELGPNMVGAAKEVLAVSLAYASSRQAFGRAIADFGAIQHMLGDAVARVFATESATWRVVGLIDADTRRRRDEPTPDGGRPDVAAFEEFAAECSIVKVLSSEMLDAVADHGVQIHGGYGYHRDYFVERAYRDARINRIFEGSNEINRLLIPSLIVKRAARAGHDLVAHAAALLDRVKVLAVSSPASDDAALVANVKAVTLLVLAAVHRHTGGTLREPQEVVLRLADAIIETFAMESVLLRSQMLRDDASLAADVRAVCLRDAVPRVEQAATEALSATLAGAEREAALAAVRALTTATPADTVAARRRLARRAIERGRYPF
jgi:alkylation response protein AidB-like acyl-CoA dehydrogenase